MEAAMAVCTEARITACTVASFVDLLASMMQVGCIMLEDTQATLGSLMQASTRPKVCPLRNMAHGALGDSKCDMQEAMLASRCKACYELASETGALGGWFLAGCIG
mmetsp:Transcript_15533/g.40144  ORF Transcript_15533/g.40144 Transcript_15533/m.40144 type:complete len:106 (+) Transcript_15533:1184-1501(+)